MRRVTITYWEPSSIRVVKCESASYNQDSRNILLRGVVDPETGRDLGNLLLPLAQVFAVADQRW